MKNSLKLVVTNALCMGFLVVSQTAFSQGALAVSTVPGLAEPLGPAYQLTRAVVKEQTRLIFYRAAVDRNPGATSVYVNGAYHASLQRGAFSELCLMPGKFEVAVRTVVNGQPVRDGYDIKDTLVLEGGRDTFVQVLHENNGRVHILPMRSEKVPPEALKTLLQQHTISRVPEAVACQEAPQALPPLPPAPSAPRLSSRTITLGADALFAFGQSSLQSISPHGRRELDELVRNIKAEFGPGYPVRMRIVGHADRLGTPAGNLKLSRDRAATIKTYFVNAGLSPRYITTEGRGDKEPIVTRCGKVANPETVNCLKPNRRVVVYVDSKKTVEAKN